MLKMYIHMPKIGFYGISPHNWGAVSMRPQRHLYLRGITYRNRSIGWHRAEFDFKNKVQLSADELAQPAASRQTCCKQRRTFSVINLQPNEVDNACEGRRFRVIVSCVSKAANFNLPAIFWCLLWRWPRLSFWATMRPFVKRFALCYRTVVLSVLPVCPVCLWRWRIVAKRLDGSNRNLACG